MSLCLLFKKIMIDPVIIEDEKSLLRNCEVCDNPWKSTYLGINTQGSSDILIKVQL